MDAIGKINGNAAKRQVNDVTLGRKDKDFIRKNVHLDRINKFVGIAHVTVPIKELPQPGHLFIGRLVR